MQCAYAVHFFMYISTYFFTKSFRKIHLFSIHFFLNNRQKIFLEFIPTHCVFPCFFRLSNPSFLLKSSKPIVIPPLAALCFLRYWSGYLLIFSCFLLMHFYKLRKYLLLSEMQYTFVIFGVRGN